MFWSVLFNFFTLKICLYSTSYISNAWLFFSIIYCHFSYSHQPDSFSCWYAPSLPRAAAGKSARHDEGDANGLQGKQAGHVVLHKQVGTRLRIYLDQSCTHWHGSCWNTCRRYLVQWYLADFSRALLGNSTAVEVRYVVFPSLIGCGKRLLPWNPTQTPYSYHKVIFPFVFTPWNPPSVLFCTVIPWYRTENLLPRAWQLSKGLSEGILHCTYFRGSNFDHAWPKWLIVWLFTPIITSRYLCRGTGSVR